jgi:hypothetical protein
MKDKKHITILAFALTLALTTLVACSEPVVPEAPVPTPTIEPVSTPEPTPEPAPELTYSITIYLNHNVNCDDYFIIEVGENTTIADISIDERGGFHFVAWSLLKSGLSRLSNDFVIAEDMEIYANWRREGGGSYLEDFVPIDRVDHKPEELLAFLSGLHRDMTIADFEDFFGVKPSGAVSGSSMFYRFVNENGDEITVSMTDGKLNSVSVSPIGIVLRYPDDPDYRASWIPDFSFFYNPDIVFDFDGIVTLNNNEFAKDSSEFPDVLLSIEAQSNNQHTGIFLNDLIKMAGGVEGIRTNWQFNHNVIGNYHWFDGEYILGAEIRPDMSVQAMGFSKTN